LETILTPMASTTILRFPTYDSAYVTQVVAEFAESRTKHEANSDCAIDQANQCSLGVVRCNRLLRYAIPTCGATEFFSAGSP
jgi:hypothetical protein